MDPYHEKFSHSLRINWSQNNHVHQHGMCHPRPRGTPDHCYSKMRLQNMTWAEVVTSTHPSKSRYMQCGKTQGERSSVHPSYFSHPYKSLPLDVTSWSPEAPASPLPLPFAVFRITQRKGKEEQMSLIHRTFFRSWISNHSWRFLKRKLLVLSCGLFGVHFCKSKPSYPRSVSPDLMVHHGRHLLQGQGKVANLLLF